MFFAPQADALVYATNEPLKFAAMCAGVRRIGADHVAVPATLDNLQLLKAADFPVIGPMQKDGYDYPIRAPWRPLYHQQVTANFLVLHKRCFCLNDMGTMKTLSALWAADYLMEMERRKGKAFRCLIAAPLSILRSVWADAIFQNMLGRRTFQVLHGTGEQREKRLARLADFYIINHDGLGVGFPSERKSPLEGLAKELSLRDDIRLSLVDEASVYRDSTTKRHKVARTLLGSREYLWLMTGTPTPNGPLDAYGLAKLVNGAGGEAFTTYKNRVMMPVGPFKWVPRFGATEAAKKLLQPGIRYAIEDCVDLPPFSVQKREAPMSTSQLKQYKELKKEAVLMIKAGTAITAVNQAALRTKLIQIACGSVYDAEHKTHDIDASPRIAVLREVMEECHEKIIVFAPLTNVLNMLHKELSQDYDCRIVNGHVPANERLEIFRGFQNGASPRVILADPATMAHGVTLTAASAVIWYAPTDKTELYIQANKRIDRPGQTKATMAVQISATNVEKEIYTRLESNQSLQGVILKLAEDKT